MDRTEIKIVTEPKVYLLGRQVVDDAELCRFLADEGVDGWTTDAPSAGEALAEIGGRLCYSSWRTPRPGGNRAYLARILEELHGSVTEHAVAALLATGISRNLSHELVRHRIGMSPSQRSQRYVDESDVAFVAPPALLPAVNGYLGSRRSRVLADAGWWQAGRAWVDHCAASLEAYASVLPYLESIGPLGDEHRTARRKMAREAARSVLPGCVETKVFLTFNGRALRNFLEQRGAAGADAEMRRFALAVLAAMSPGWPNLLADCRVEDHPEAGPVIVTEHRKV